MKRSVKVPLLVLGSVAALNGCSPNPEPEWDIKQQLYSSREECLQDWNDEDSCTQSVAIDDNFNTHPTSNWYGPRYYWDRDINRPIQLRPDGTTRILRNTMIDANKGSSIGTNFHRGSVSRGGFGSFAHGFSGGG